MDYDSLYFEPLKQAMYHLIKTNDVDEFKHLVGYCKIQPQDHGKGFNCFIAGKGSNHTSAMLLAASLGKTDILRYLIEDEAIPVNDVNESGVGMMFNALSERHFDTAEYLLSCGADLLIRTKKNTNLLAASLKAGSKAWTLRLLDAGLSLAECNEAGRSAMHWAAESGDLSLLDWVHEQTQLTYDVAAADGITPLYRAGNLSMFLHICEKTSATPLSEEQLAGNQFLFHFNSMGKADIVAYLLDQLSDTKFLRSSKCLMVMMAVRSGNTDLVHLLLERDFSPEGRDSKNYRALHFASSYGHLEQVRLLVEIGKAKLEVHENQNFFIRKTRTPLFLAIEKRHTEVALYLIARSKDLNVLCDSSNSTALCEACDTDNIVVIQNLLEKGASPNGVNRDKESSYPDFFRYPLGFVQSAEAVHLLMQYGADINATEKGSSASNALEKLVKRIEKNELNSQAGLRKLDAVKALIDYGIELNLSANASLEREATCLEVVEIIRYARNNPKTPGTPSQQAESNRRYWEGMMLVAGALTGKSDEVMEELTKAPVKHLTGLVLWETAEDCTSKDRLEIFNSYLVNAKIEDVNYVKRDIFHSDNESVLHLLLWSVRSSSPSEYATEKEIAETPTLRAYRETLKCMLDIGANPNGIERVWGGNALLTALKMLDCFHEKEELAEIHSMIKLLLEHGADTYQTNYAGLNFFDALVYYVREDWLYEFAPVTVSIAYSSILLLHLKEKNWDKVLHGLEHYPVDFLIRDRNGDNLMTAAVRTDHLEIMQKLLQLGGSIRDQDAYGYAAMQLACHHSAYEIANHFLDEGLLDIDMLNERSGNLKKSLLMDLNYGTKINSAAGRSVVKKLLEAGIDLNLKDADGKTIFEYPIDKRFRSLLEKYHQ